ncbi:MAG: N-acetyl-gamma-glutamyl-phosphate reductase [Ideonella sp.]|nr:N-acetyl-gamma-glutamyl-phosphate reductase [Ideonella sp.]MCC7456672.1 N-acetyl-gamma-glutamyl-phosphate reductase [Nitrospira sp.]
MFKVFVDGQEGTTGLQINDLLAQRSDIEVLRIDSALRKDATERARLLNAADVAFLCLPDAAAREAAALVTNSRTCVIDASTAHRIDPAWAFGLPELAPGQRERLCASKRISNPGCHSTAFILLVRPLVDAGLLAAATSLTATSITGYSGGGRKMIEQYEAKPQPTKLGSPRPYGLSLSHKHVPEMRVHAGLAMKPIFMPVVSNFYKGLTVSVPLHLSKLPGNPSAAHLHEALAARYTDERFIRVMPLSDPATLDDGYFDVQACNGTNRCELFVFAAGDQAVLMARLDNLGKGASGAAVQNMNIHLGLDEQNGLVA